MRDMTQEITLLHRIGPERFGFADELARSKGIFSFQTCLRHLVIASVSAELTSSDEVLVGHDIYRFLLEVICGLRSSLIGETEVYGQFRTAVQLFHGPSSPWGLQATKIFRALFEDAKRIRGEHLKDLGSQSYGSLLRRELREHS
jgi:glutamyl-tRNA reductase